MRTVIAGVLAALFVMTSSHQRALGQNMSVSYGDPVANFRPELTERNIALLVRVLGLNESEAQAVRELHTGYTEGLLKATREWSETLEERLELAQTMGDQGLIHARGGVDWQSQEKQAEAMKARFLDDLKALLTRQQADRWPIAERELRRLKQIGNGIIPGERIDVVRLVEDIAPEALEPGAASLQSKELSEVLEQYCVQVDRTIVARDNFLKEASPTFEDLRRSDPDKADSIFADARRLRLAVRDINRRFMAQIAPLLPAPQREELEKTFFDQSYGFQVEPTRSEQFILAAAELETLTPQQRTAIGEVIAAYKTRRDAAVRRIASELDALWNDTGPRPKLPAANEGEADGDHFSSRGQFGPDHPLMAARQARFDLDRSTRRTISALLTREQIEAIPNDRRGVASFQSIDVNDL